MSKKVAALEVDSDEALATGGFLSIRRIRLKNRREDGSRSEPYLVDFATRSMGVDAVAVVVYRRRGSAVEVLLRECLRPAVSLGRDQEALPVAEDDAPLMLWEVVAGIIEKNDTGERGIRERAAAEVWEEAGYRVSADEVEVLGAPFFASPGSLCEQVYAARVEIAADAEQAPLEGDGSPMEEGATTRWTSIDDAIAECMRGTIRDLKTEVLLRRLRDVIG